MFEIQYIFDQFYQQNFLNYLLIFNVKFSYSFFALFAGTLRYFFTRNFREKDRFFNSIDDDYMQYKTPHRFNFNSNFCLFVCTLIVKGDLTTC